MSELCATDLATSILQHLRSKVSPECFQTWFKDLSVVSVDGDKLRLATANRYVKQWLENHYGNELLGAAKALLPEIKQVELSIANYAPAKEHAILLGKALPSALPAGLRPKSSANDHNRYAMNESASGGSQFAFFANLSLNLTFKTFVAGKCNRIAYTAAQTVVETPASAYNPLFLHGAQGLGKTHLLQGIGSVLHERNPDAPIAYISCEEFTNAYLTALQSKRLDSFRARYRSCHALLMDDVQFLAGRDKTQEEFLHTFDALRHAKKQIVLCANAAPRDIKRLNPQLASRFQSGLVARLDAPEPDMRVAILCAKANTRGLTLAKDVAEVLAAHIHSNIRELEGAVCKLMALAVAESRPPDRELAIVALRELGYLRSGPLHLQDILTSVSQHYSVTPDEIRSDKRHASLVRVRHISMYLSTQLCSHSLAEIGRFYGNRDHATVLHAVKKITGFIKADEVLKHELQALRQVLGR